MLTGCTLSGFDLGHADLSNADLTGANLSGCDLGMAKLRGAILIEARLVDAYLVGAELQQANLRRAVLERAKLLLAELNEMDVTEATLTDADFSGFVDPKGGGVSTLDLTQVRGLDAVQLTGMRGNDYTRLPAGFAAPGHWPSVFENEDAKQAKPKTKPQSAPPDGRILARVVRRQMLQNGAAISLLSASLMEQIAQYREVIRGDNALGATNPDLRDNLLGFLDRLANALTEIKALAEHEDTDIAAATGWAKRFTASAIPEWKAYIKPEALGKASAPAGMVLGCGALGALVTGFNPLGFGLGALVGKMITGEMKSGAATDKLSDMMKDDPTPK